MAGTDDWRSAVTRRFRWAGYLGAALLSAMLAVCSDQWFGAGLGFVAFAAVPRLLTKLGSTSPHADALATGGLAGAAGLPVWMTLALVGVLLIGLTARDGPRRGVAMAVVAGAGWLGARVVSPLPLLPGSPHHDLLSLGYLVCLAIPIAGVAYRWGRHWGRENARLEDQAAGLGNVVGALASYLPEPVAARLMAMNFEPALERRWVSVCFVDLTGFTRLVDRLAPESVVELLNDFGATVRQLAASRGGVLDKLMGDGALVFFRADQREHRQRAARSSAGFVAELRPAIDGLEQRWRSFGVDESLAVHCGVASGYCSVGDIGDAARRHYTVVGGPVNTASRLQQLAIADVAMLDAATAGFLKPGSVIPMGRRSVKGLSDPVVVFSMTLGGSGQPGPAAPASRSRPGYAKEA